MGIQKQPLTIIKIGGKVLADPKKLSAVLKDFAAISTLKILVHGGGKKASELSKQLNIPIELIDGRRVTNKAILEIVTMVYAGLINKNIVAQLQAINCNALGLSGADMNAIQSHKRVVKEIDYGFAGDIDQVNGKGISNLLEQNITPVFCAITHNKKGQLLNTNADTIAAELAASLSPYYEVKLLFCFEKNGVLSNPEKDDSVIHQISLTNYKEYKKMGIITDGMIPKLDNAFYALDKNASEVFICGTNAIKENAAKGTRLCL